MNKATTAKQQKGFFDFGFSLAVLALSGALAYSVTPAAEDRTAAQDPQIEVAARMETADKNTDLQQ